MRWIGFGEWLNVGVNPTYRYACKSSLAGFKDEPAGMWLRSAGFGEESAGLKLRSVGLVEKSAGIRINSAGSWLKTQLESLR